MRVCVRVSSAPSEVAGSSLRTYLLFELALVARHTRKPLVSAPLPLLRGPLRVIKLALHSGLGAATSRKSERTRHCGDDPVHPSNATASYQLGLARRPPRLHHLSVHLSLLCPRLVLLDIPVQRRDLHKPTIQPRR